MLIGYFVFEIFIKLYAEENKLNYFKDKWNLFDFIIISISLIPMGLLTTNIAILRLMRIFKVLRIVSGSGNLKVVINLVLTSLPSIFNVLLLMLIVFYIYAVAGIALFADIHSPHWKDLSSAMLTLFRVFTFNWYDFLKEVSPFMPYAWIYFISFFLINTLILLNIMIAILVNEVSKLQDKKIHDEIREEMDINRQILNEISIIKEELLQRKKDV